MHILLVFFWGGGLVRVAIRGLQLPDRSFNSSIRFSVLECSVSKSGR
jgi:hypothetical protein